MAAHPLSVRLELTLDRSIYSIKKSFAVVRSVSPIIHALVSSLVIPHAQKTKSWSVQAISRYEV